LKKSSLSQKFDTIGGAMRYVLRPAGRRINRFTGTGLLRIPQQPEAISKEHYK